jgi:hypothetical protein
MQIHFQLMFDKFQDLKEILEIQALLDLLDEQVHLDIEDMMHRMAQLEIQGIQGMMGERVVLDPRVLLD